MPEVKPAESFGIPQGGTGFEKPSMAVAPLFIQLEDAVPTTEPERVIIPVPGVEYEGRAHFGGRSRTFAFTISKKLCQEWNGSHRVDLNRGELIGPDGERSRIGQKPGDSLDKPWHVRDQHGRWGVPLGCAEFFSNEGELTLWCKNLVTDDLITPDHRLHEVTLKAPLSGKDISLNVGFSPAFVEWCQSRDVVVDLPNARALLADGTSLPLLQNQEPRRVFERQMGVLASPWTLPSIAQAAIIPQGQTTIELLNGRPFCNRFESAVREYSVLRNGRDVHFALPEQVYQPLSLEGWSHDDTVPDVSIRASSPELSARARELFLSVVGERARLGLDREELAREKDFLRRLDEALARGAGSSELAKPSPALETAREYLAARGVLEAEKLHGPDEIRQSLNKYSQRIDLKLRPIRINVVPNGSTVDSFPGHPRETEATYSVARVEWPGEFSERKFVEVFIPELSLTDSQYRIQAVHEFYHVMEEYFLSPAEHREMDRLHQQQVRAGGQFSSDYGWQRSEWVTTLGEEFEGLLGKDGPAWLQSNYPSVHRIFTEVTGRSPTAAGPRTEPERA